MTLLLVLGRPRSGTSLVARTIATAGYSLPSDERPADEQNPEGYAESKWVLFHSGRVCRAAGISLESADIDRADLDRLTDEDERAGLLTWLRDQPKDLVVKDPRLCWTLPMWLDVAGQLRRQVKIVHVLRPPGPAVESWSRYLHRAPTEADYQAWQLGVTQALVTSEGIPTAHIFYRDVIVNPTAAFERLAAELDEPQLAEVALPTIRRPKPLGSPTPVEAFWQQLCATLRPASQEPSPEAAISTR